MTLENLLNKGIISIHQSVSILDVEHPMAQSLYRFSQFNLTTINHNNDDMAALEKYGKCKVCFMYTSHVGDPNMDNDIFVKLQKPHNFPKEVENE